MSSCTLNEEKHALQQIIEASEAIRKKHKLIKLDKDDTEKALNEVFKPMVTPLQKLVEQSADSKRSFSRKPKKRKLDTHEIDYQIKHSRPSFSNQMEDDSETLPNISESYSPTLKRSDSNEENEEYHSMIEDKDEENSMIEDKNEENSMKDGDDENQGSNLAETYLQLLISSKGKKELEPQVGVRILKNRRVIGTTPIEFEGRNIKIGDMAYQQTPGLLELLFKLEPNEKVITDNDKRSYTKIVESTHLDMAHYNPARGLRQRNRERITKFLIKSLEGRGLSNQMIARRKRHIDYVYWDDPNELVDRLRLLYASQCAGNNSHNNEIISIIEELREAGLIY